jgi:hypothetical protein
VNSAATSISAPRPSRCSRPARSAVWTVRWSSEDRAYGGSGTFPADSADGWRCPARARCCSRRRPKDEPAGEPWPELNKDLLARAGERERQS